MVTRPDASAGAIVDFGHHPDGFNLDELAINAAELRTWAAPPL